MTENAQYVKYSEYNALKQKYDTMRARNQELNRLIKSMTESIEIIKTTYDSIVNINNSLPKLEDIKAILSRPQTNNNSTNRKEEFETKTDSDMSDQKIFPLSKRNNTSVNTNINSNNISSLIMGTVIKKLEESEIFIGEMTRQYNILVLKYNYLQEDKENSESNNKMYIDQIQSLTERITSLLTENTNFKTIIQRQKYNEKCLVYTVNDLVVLNENNSQLKVRQKESFTCEPLPSFVRFMNK